MNGFESLIPISVLRSLVRLDCDTWRLYWEARGIEYFTDGAQTAAHNCAIWNGRHAGEEAFATLSGNGYLHGALFDRKICAHRVVFALFYGRWPSNTIDHIDGNKTHNAPTNLRDVTHQTNMKNQPRRLRSTGCPLGVYFDKRRRNYEAYITIDGRKKALGRFQNLSDAVAARSAANTKYGYHENHGRQSV